MTTLLEIRDRIIQIYRQFETPFNIAFKFAAVLLGLLAIEGQIGYQKVLTGPLFLVLISLLCALLPMGGIVAVITIVSLVQLQTLSTEALLVGALYLLIALLAYFRFSPRDLVLLVMAPMCQLLGIPYLIPLLGGLLFTPASAATSAVAVFYWSFISFIHSNETSISTTTDESGMTARFRLIMDGTLQNQQTIIMIIAVVAAAIIVYVIRRLRIRYAWQIATGVGAIVELIVVLIGDMLYGTSVSIGAVFGGVIASALTCIVVTFFRFNLDYTRIENAQFEDDDYYYYVRMIPKNLYTAPRRRVTQISSTRHQTQRRASHTVQGVTQQYDEPQGDEGYEEGDADDGYQDEDQR